VDVRLIAATHRDLSREVEEGRLREDLYYRLYILPIHLPPLKERKEDIPLLAEHFLISLSRELQKPGIVLTQGAMDVLTAYEWPGNIRELANVLERAVVLAEGNIIDVDSLGFMAQIKAGTKIAERTLDLDTRLADLEKQLLIQALEATKGVKAKAARLLGIKEGALYYKLEKYGLLEKR
jgi:DNA-binding NtrC family response regulator